jgi:chorismate-pyruvate lyase
MEGNMVVIETVSSTLREMFRAQRLMPAWVEDLDFHALSDYHRMVLINDGSTQPLVMARFLEPLTVVPLDLGTNPISGRRWLKDRPVRFRKVEICGRTTARVHIVANTTYVPDLLPKDLVEGLENGALSVGAGIRRFSLTTRRELLWCGRTADYPVVRTYRIYHGYEPVFAITEMFA